MEVSWQVTGNCKDPWAEQNRMVAEEEKPEEAKGSYVHPEVYDQGSRGGWLAVTFPEESQPEEQVVWDQGE